MARRKQTTFTHYDVRRKVNRHWEDYSRAAELPYVRRKDEKYVPRYHRNVRKGR